MWRGHQGDAGGAGLVAAERAEVYEAGAGPDVGPAGGVGGGVPSAVVDLRTAARAAGNVDFDRLDREALTAAVEVLAAAESAVAAVKARAVRAVQTAGVADADGAADTTSWLKDRLNLSGRKAKKQDERARRLGRLPDTRGALDEGTIGPEHADIIGRAAADGRLGSFGETEGQLLEAAADKTPDQLRAEVKRREQEADESSLVDDENQAHAFRWATAGPDGDDGSWKLFAGLAPVDGEIVDTALQAYTTQDPKDTPKGLRRTPKQKRADALVDMARAALRAAEAPTSGGVRPHVSVLVDYDDLIAETGGTATTGSGQIISGEAARRLACDAGLRRIVTKGGSQVLDVGRATRHWSSAQRAAVVARDQTCRWPGCDRPAGWCIVHHATFWTIQAGITAVSNGVLLCPHHHRRVHEEHWTLNFDSDTGRVEVISPTGRIRRTSHPPGSGPAGADPPDPG